jgi:hypothetical protein
MLTVLSADETVSLEQRKKLLSSSKRLFLRGYSITTEFKNQAIIKYYLQITE